MSFTPIGHIPYSLKGENFCRFFDQSRKFYPRNIYAEIYYMCRLSFLVVSRVFSFWCSFTIDYRAPGIGNPEFSVH